MNDFFEFTGWTVGCVTIFITAIFLSIIQPIVSATFAFIGIHIVIWIAPIGGDIVVTGMHLLGLSEVTLVQLPAIAAALAFIGSYFRSSNTNKCTK